MGTIEKRLEVVKTALEIGIVKSAALHGYDRKTVSNWVKKYQISGCAGLENSLKVKSKHPDSIPEDIVSTIIALKQKHAELSASQIKERLDLPYSLTAINKKIRQAGLNQDAGQQIEPNSKNDFILIIRQNRDWENYNFRFEIIHCSSKIVFPGYLQENNISSVMEFIKGFQSVVKISDKMKIFHNLAYLNKKSSDLVLSDLELIYKSDIDQTIYKKFHLEFTSIADSLTDYSDIYLKNQTAWLIYNHNQTTENHYFEFHCTKLFCLPELKDEVNSNLNRIDTLVSYLKNTAHQFAKQNKSENQMVVYEILLKISNTYKLNELMIETLQSKVQQMLKKNMSLEPLNILKNTERLCKKIGNDHLLSKNYGITGIVYQQTGQLSLAARHLKLQYELSQKNNNQNEFCQACLSLGVLLGNQGFYKKAMNYYDQGIEAAKVLGKKNIRLTILGNIGVIYWRRGKFSDAYEYFKAAYSMAVELNNQRQIARLSGNLGAVLDEMYQFGAAREHYLIQFDMAKTTGNIALQTAALNNLGSNLITCGEMPQALDYLRKANDLAAQSDDLEKQAVILGELGSVYQKIGELDLSRDYFNRAIQKCLKLHETFFLGSFYLRLAEIDFSGKKYQAAQKSNISATKMLKENNRAKLLIESRILAAKIKLYTNKNYTEVDLLEEFDIVLDESHCADCKAAVEKEILNHCKALLCPERFKVLVNNQIRYYKKLFRISGLNLYREEVASLKRLFYGE